MNEVEQYENSQKQIEDSIDEFFNDQFSQFIIPINEGLPIMDRVTRWSANYIGGDNKVRLAIMKIGEKELEIIINLILNFHFQII